MSFELMKCWLNKSFSNDDLSDENVSDSQIEVNKAKFFGIHANNQQEKLELNDRRELKVYTPNSMNINIFPENLSNVPNYESAKLMEFNQVDRRVASPYAKTSNIDTFYKLIIDDNYVNTFLDDLSQRKDSEEIVGKMLIDLFKNFNFSPRKASEIANKITSLFGGDIQKYTHQKNPIVEAWRFSQFEAIKYAIGQGVYLWHLLVDKNKKNVMHYLSENNEFELAKQVVNSVMIAEVDSKTKHHILRSLIFSTSKDEFLTPKLLADPHRAVWKYLEKLEYFIIRQSIFRARISKCSEEDK